MKTTARIAAMRLWVCIYDLIDDHQSSLDDTPIDDLDSPDAQIVTKNLELLQDAHGVILDCVQLVIPEPMSVEFSATSEDDLKNAISEVEAVVNYDYGERAKEFEEVKDALKRVLDLLTALEY